MVVLTYSVKVGVIEKWLAMVALWLIPRPVSKDDTFPLSSMVTFSIRKKVVAEEAV